MNDNYYFEIEPSEVNIYFKQRLVNAIRDNVKEQILNGNPEHLLRGKGVFLFEDVPTDQGIVKIAVVAFWISNDGTKAIELLNLVKYYLFKGNLPDSILDKINELGTDVTWQKGALIK